MRWLMVCWLGFVALGCCGCGEGSGSQQDAGASAAPSGDRAQAQVDLEAKQAAMVAARRELAAIAAVLEKAQYRASVLEAAAKEHRRLSAELDAAEMQSAAQKKVYTDLERYYKRERLVMPRKDRRKFIDAQAKHEAIEETLSGLREQVAALQEQADALEQAVAERKAAEAAYDEARAALDALAGR